jgi:hypothetical protein|tara:strand:+ start:2669 stop:2887 length:219 start_codon:yes stop_codon:yes gene_type:complete
MSDYYVSSSNLTFSLYEDRVMYNEGSGSNIGVKREITQQWFLNQTELTIVDIIKITEQVSGSNTYVKDKGWY